MAINNLTQQESDEECDWDGTINSHPPDSPKSKFESVEMEDDSEDEFSDLEDIQVQAFSSRKYTSHQCIERLVRYFEN
jgi:hypothetical protein